MTYEEAQIKALRMFREGKIEGFEQRTQQDVADSLGFERPMISLWENRRRSPRLEIIQSWIKALKIEDDLFSYVVDGLLVNGEFEGDDDHD